MSGRSPDITQAAWFNQAAAEAREASRRYWAKGGPADKRFPVQPEARFWPIAPPADPEGVLFINARGVRVLCTIHELLTVGDVDAIESLIIREITRVPECP